MRDLGEVRHLHAGLIAQLAFAPSPISEDEMTNLLTLGAAIALQPSPHSGFVDVGGKELTEMTERTRRAMWALLEELKGRGTKEIAGPQWLILSALYCCGFRIDYPGAIRELHRVGLHPLAFLLESMSLPLKELTGFPEPLMPASPT